MNDNIYSIIDKYFTINLKDLPLGYKTEYEYVVMTDGGCKKLVDFRCTYAYDGDRCKVIDLVDYGWTIFVYIYNHDCKELFELTIDEFKLVK